MSRMKLCNFLLHTAFNYSMLYYKEEFMEKAPFFKKNEEGIIEVAFHAIPDCLTIGWDLGVQKEIRAAYIAYTFILTLNCFSLLGSKRVNL